MKLSLLCCMLLALVMESCRAFPQKEGQSPSDLSRDRDSVEARSVPQVKPPIPEAQSSRDRIRIFDNTLVTDRYEPLRGASYWISKSTMKFYQDHPEEHRAYFRSLSQDYRINVVRLAIYDQYQTLDPASVADMVSRVVDWAEEDGLYAIINWHNDYGGYTTRIDEAQMQRFWDYYAPLYKDRKHVIFEGSNETVTDPGMQIKIYNRIRELAPDSHIILWTPPNTDKVDIEAHIRWSEAAGISYQNASIGYHPYGGVSAHDRAIAWKKAGFPVICTEVPTYADASWGNLDYSVLMPHLKKMEDNGIGWVSFMSAAHKLPRGDTNFSPLFLDKLNEVGLEAQAKLRIPLDNADFELDAGLQQTPQSWLTWSPEGAFHHADYVERYQNNNRLTHYAQTDYTVYTFQILTVPNGNYRLSVLSKRQGAFLLSQLKAKHFGGSGEVSAALADSSDWTKTSLDKIAVTNGQIEVGVYSVGSAGALTSFDRFELVRID